MSKDFVAGTNTLKNEWYEQPLHGPKAGDRIIFFAYVSDTFDPEKDRLVLQGPIIIDSAENREEILQRMAPQERTMAIQFPVAAAIILLPLASIFLMDV